jgi:hypothetical protein
VDDRRDLLQGRQSDHIPRSRRPPSRCPRQPA